MHKHTKLPPAAQGGLQGRTQRSLADECHVDNELPDIPWYWAVWVIPRYMTSTNERYRTLEYGLKKLMKTEERLQKRANFLAIKLYEKSYPGEMVHADTKLLRRLQGERPGTCTENGTRRHRSLFAVPCRGQSGRYRRARVRCTSHGARHKPALHQATHTTDKWQGGAGIRTLMEEWHRTHWFA